MLQWTIFLKHLDTCLGKQTVDTWLRPLKVSRFDARNLFLDAQNSFQITWFKEYVANMAPKHLTIANGNPINIHFSIQGTPYSKNKQPVDKKPSLLFPFNPLESHATLDSFIPSIQDPLTYNILKKLVINKSNDNLYNPIYIYGPSGTGKSHLLMGVAHLLKQTHTCCYVTAHTFTEHVIRAFRSTSLKEFRNLYRNLDILIIDDIHHFSRKTTTQEELFHTFNHLHTAGKQIILSANSAPNQLDEIEKRLVSRFEWGITLPLQDPDTNIKTTILENRALLLNMPITTALKEFFLHSFRSLNTMIQALEALTLRLPQISHAPDIEIVKHHLKDLITKEEKEEITHEKILKYVATTFGITTADILGKQQTRTQVIPRQITMYLLRNILKMSFLKIARIFSKDHSTVIASVKKVEAGIKKKEAIFTCPLKDIMQLIKT